MMSKPTPQRIITIFGASGFIGRQVLRTLAKTKTPDNLALRLASRNVACSPPSRWRQLAPSIQNISPQPCDISDPEQVARVLDGASDVINCVGILYETPSRGITFDRIQMQGPRAIADVISTGQSTVKNVVHLSAIGADKDSKSDYARTKAAGESEIQRLAKLGLAQVTILRPSIVFGPEDSFFNRFKEMSRFVPFLPLVGGGRTKFQPVHVEDVARAIIKNLFLDDGTHEQPMVTYELGGPTVFTFKQLMELLLEATGRRRLLVPIPFPMANFQGATFEAIHKLVPRIPPMLTRDQVRLLETDNIVAPDARTLYDLKIEPIQCSIETVSYLR